MCGAIKVSRGYIHFPTRWTSLLSKRIPLAKFTSSTKQTKQFLTQSGDFNLNGDDINMAYAQKSHTSIIPHCINILSKTGLFKCRQSGQSFLVSMFIMSVSVMSVKNEDIKQGMIRNSRDRNIKTTSETSNYPIQIVGTQLNSAVKSESSGWK